MISYLSLSLPRHKKNSPMTQWKYSEIPVLAPSEVKNRNKHQISLPAFLLLASTARFLLRVLLQSCKDIHKGPIQDPSGLGLHDFQGFLSFQGIPAEI